MTPHNRWWRCGLVLAALASVPGVAGAQEELPPLLPEQAVEDPAQPDVTEAPPVAPAPLKSPERVTAPEPWRRVTMGAVSGAAGAATVLAVGLAVGVPVAVVAALVPSETYKTRFWGAPMVLVALVGTLAVVGVAAMLGGVGTARGVRQLLGSNLSRMGGLLGGFALGALGLMSGMALADVLLFHPPRELDVPRKAVTGNLTTPQTWALVLGLGVLVAIPLAALGTGLGAGLGADLEDTRIRTGHP